MAELSLQQLLEKKISGGGLDADEGARAWELIHNNPTISERSCWMCANARPFDVGKAILDTSLCSRHATFALTHR